MSDVEQRLLNHLQQAVSESGQTQQVAADTELLALGLLDSIGLVSLISFMEQEFGITLADQDITPELFETPRSIAAFVEQHRR